MFRQLHALFDLILLSKILYRLDVKFPVLEEVASIKQPSVEVADSYPAVMTVHYGPNNSVLVMSGGVVTGSYLGNRHKLHYDDKTMDNLRSTAQLLSGNGKVALPAKGVTLTLVVPSDRHSNFNEGLTAMTRKKFDVAEKWFTTVIEEDPFFSECYVQRSHARVNLGNMQGAREDLEKAIGLNPEERMLRVMRFVLLIEMGMDTDEIDAKPETKTAIANIVFEKSNAAFMYGDNKNAMEGLNSVLKLDPNYAEAYSLRGWIKLLQGDYEGAYMDASKSVELVPDSARAYSIRGTAAIALGPEDDEYYEDAYDDFTMALEIAPEVPEWWFNRARVMDAWGNRAERDSDIARGHEAAINQYTELIKKQPDNSALYIKRGMAEAAAGEVKLAVRDYDIAIQKDPEMAVAYIKRASARHTQERYADAARDASKAIELAPDSAESYAARGAARYKLKEYQPAMSDCNKALRLDPKYAYAYHIRALVKLDREDPGGAIQDWEAAIEANPASEGFYRQLIKEASY